MKIHILGIGGTFMAGLALIAKQLGFEVSGSDQNIYPPMSTVLTDAGINVIAGYESKQFVTKPDVVLIGNALSRGNPAIEMVLNKGWRYLSGPQWLAEEVLQHRHVLAVAGTHGKTTTTALLAWILEQANLSPGYLIGGMPKGFAQPAIVGKSPYFVIESDEYDTAFFDKRPKFLHYRPRTLILNNLEYDHADIYPDLESIKKQFHYLIRTVPASGTIIYSQHDFVLDDVISRGCWSRRHYINSKEGWRAKLITADGSEFECWHRDQKCGVVRWQMVGEHNVQNALAAIAAANEVGVGIETIVLALTSFQGVKRRLELRGEIAGVRVYDDFAHHPTAIEKTLAGLRARVGDKRIVAVVELGSNSMKQGANREQLANALREANKIFFYLPPDLKWDVQAICAELGSRAQVSDSVTQLLATLSQELKNQDHVCVMSNKSFENIHQRLLECLVST